MKLPCLDCGKSHERSEDCANGENRIADVSDVRTDFIKIQETLMYLNDMNYSSDDFDSIRALLTKETYSELPERAKNWYERYKAK